MFRRPPTLCNVEGRGQKLAAGIFKIPSGNLPAILVSLIELSNPALSQELEAVQSAEKLENGQARQNRKFRYKEASPPIMRAATVIMESMMTVRLRPRRRGRPFVVSEQVIQGTMAMNADDAAADLQR